MGAKNGKSSGAGGTTSGPPAKDRFKSTAQNRQFSRNLQKVMDGTAVRTGSGFLKDRQGNIVSYSGGATKARADQQKAIRDAIAQNIQAQEAKQVTPTRAGITSVLDRMKQDRQNLLDRAKQNRITNQQLNQLGKLNRDLGFNRTTGMGVIESLRDQFTKPEFKQGIGNLVKAYQRISPLGLLMRNILNPQFEDETGIQSLPEFKGLQRTNQMFGPGVYDFTQPTRMPSNMAGAIPGLSSPMQFAELTEDQKNFMKSRNQQIDFQKGNTLEQKKDSLFNKVKQLEDTGIFGYGAQEPTTREEFEDFISSPEYKSAFI